MLQKMKRSDFKEYRHLDAWPETAEETLDYLQRFVGIRERNDEYMLQLCIYNVNVTSAEIAEVLAAEDKLQAAHALMTVKSNVPA